MHICIDACFKLVRKNKGHAKLQDSGNSTEFWVDQAEVDKAAERDIEVEVDRDCSSFAAGNTAIANRRNKKCSITGVIGFNCRHQHPGLYADMRSGEK